MLNSLTKLFLFAVLLVFAGASAVSLLPTRNEGLRADQDSVRVSANSQADTNAIRYIELGQMLVSWYGKGFQGRKTANGEIFDQEALTTAHRYFRFGTLLRLTNPDNDKSIIVRVNDRGPFAGNRQLDISKGAAEELDMMKKGVARLKVEQVTLQGVYFPVIPFN